MYKYTARKGLNKKEIKQVTKIVNKSKKYKMYFGGFGNGYVAIDGSAWVGLTEIAGTQGLDGITEGTESYQRQGDTIMVKHYKITLNMALLYQSQLETPANVNAVPGSIRIVVARLFGLYTGTELDYFSDGTINANWLVEKGTVMKDKRIFIGRSLDNKQVTCNIKCKTKRIPHMLVEYDDNDPVGVQKNDIRVFIFASNLTNASNTLGVDLNESIGYYDKY